ncbi:MAG: putative 5xTM rane YitT family [Firmicutes bacterium]|nr:putative 5xTM rane YitT family [Bacillota bacterium]
MPQKLLQYLMISVGCILAAVSINVFFVPHHLLSYGISGLAIIFYYLYTWPIGIQMLIMNLPIFFLAYRLLGKSYVLSTIYGAVFLSVAIDATRFLSHTAIIDDPIISAITGGIINGLGAGLMFRVNGSAGGLDIVASIIKKYYSFNIGLVTFGINLFIMLFAACFFGLKLAVLTLIAMFIGAQLTDKVVQGFNNKKSIYIISYTPEKIVESIIREVGRGATILNGVGAYTRQSKQVIFVVVNLTQITQLKQLVHTADPDAFMIVSDAAEVLGKGFTLPQILKS